MTERTSLLHEVGQAFRENGLTAAMRKLLIFANALLRDDRKWNESSA